MNNSELLLFKSLIEKNIAALIRCEAYHQTTLIEIAKLRAKTENKDIEVIRDEQEYVYDRQIEILSDLYTDGFPEK